MFELSQQVKLKFVILIVLYSSYFTQIFYLKHILSCNCLVFNSFSKFFYWHVFNHFFLDNLRNIFSFILDCLIFSNLSCYWYLNLSSDFFIFHYGLFIRNVLNSWLSFNCLSSLCSNNYLLRLYWNLLLMHLKLVD